MRYFINLINTGREDREKSNGHCKTYWEIESEEQGLKIKENIFRQFQEYDYSSAQESQSSEFHTFFNILGVQEPASGISRIIDSSNYQVEAFDEIHDYLNQEIGEDKINVELK